MEKVVVRQIIKVVDSGYKECFGPKNTFKKSIRIDWDPDRNKLICPKEIMTSRGERFCMACPLVELGKKQKKRTAENWEVELGRKDPAILRSLFKECKY